MDLKTTVNSAGIILTIFGVYIAFVNSPINEKEIVDTIDNNSKDYNRKNKKMKAGVWSVMIGSILQLASNFIPACS